MTPSYPINSSEEFLCEGGSNGRQVSCLLLSIVVKQIYSSRTHDQTLNVETHEKKTLFLKVFQTFKVFIR